MAKYRVTMAFDLDLLDEQEARAVAAEHMRQLAQAAIAQGGRIESSYGSSPEVAAHGVAAENPRAVATIVARAIIAQGVYGQSSWLEVGGEMQINSEPLD